ncbi:MAG: aminoglycoside phosphotransferase family protein [Treponema sp.]|jgi:tRNA A-37 threonylcarbamoyl transferase component Bud32|nr:aminoglycoside phosphotransferase family protein [Treponema sp.]
MNNYKLEKIIAERKAKTIYRDGDKVIKLMGDEYPAPDVLSEAHNLAVAGETALKVPQLVEVTKINGKWAVVWEYVEGTTLDRLMEKDKGKVAAYLERFVDIQIDMHRHSTTRLPLLAEKMERKIKASELDATARYEILGRLSGMPKHTKLCHGDFNPSNIVINEADEAYIIDWSHAAQGNASADAAQTYLLFRLAGNTDMAEKYLALFCKKSDTAKQYVEKWLSIVAASQLPKAKAEDRELLLHWANIAEYQ